jgi:hypothetical protein
VRRSGGVGTSRRRGGGLDAGGASCATALVRSDWQTLEDGGRTRGAGAADAAAGAAQVRLDPGGGDVGGGEDVEWEHVVLKEAGPAALFGLPQVLRG